MHCFTIIGTFYQTFKIVCILECIGFDVAGDWYMSILKLQAFTHPKMYLPILAQKNINMLCFFDYF